MLHPDAGDLDIAVTDKGLEQIKSNYELKQKENGWYIVKDKVECICDGDKSKLKYQPELIGNIYVQNIQDYLEFLYTSERQKDKDRIPLVEDYIKSLNQIFRRINMNDIAVVVNNDNINVTPFDTIDAIKNFI